MNAFILFAYITTIAGSGTAYVQKWEVKDWVAKAEFTNKQTCEAAGKELFRVQFKCLQK